MAFARRAFLKSSLGAIGAAGVLGAAPLALAFPERDVRRLMFDNLHTGEQLAVAYWEDGAYVPQALWAVNRVLRDHRTNEVHIIAPGLLDLLTALSGTLQSPAVYEVISGYRSASTNAMLHAESAQVATGSLHMKGEAIDIRMPGRACSQIRDAALYLYQGGVGYYGTSDFVHVDVGQPRTWSGA
ncbi:MAG: YcbK family protein [Caulobacteraceae bacterium]